jgi:carbonic anhydrase
LTDRRLGLSDQWLKHVRDVREKHRKQLAELDFASRFKRLCELNVIEQVLNVANTSILREAWSRQQKISIHGWIYAIDNGLLRDLRIPITNSAEVPQQYEAALRSLTL